MDSKILLECLNTQKELVLKHSQHVNSTLTPAFLKNYKTYGMFLPRQIGKSTIATNLYKQYENPIILCINKKEAIRLNKQYNVLSDSISGFINRSRGSMIDHDAYILDEFDGMEPEQIEKLYELIPTLNKHIKDIDIIVLTSKW